MFSFYRRQFVASMVLQLIM